MLVSYLAAIVWTRCGDGAEHEILTADTREQFLHLGQKTLQHTAQISIDVTVQTIYVTEYDVNFGTIIIKKISNAFHLCDPPVVSIDCWKNKSEVKQRPYS